MEVYRYVKGELTKDQLARLALVFRHQHGPAKILQDLKVDWNRSAESLSPDLCVPAWAVRRLKRQALEVDEGPPKKKGDPRGKKR